MKVSYDMLDNSNETERKTFSYRMIDSIDTLVSRILTKVLKLDYKQIPLRLRSEDVYRGEQFVDDVIESYEDCPDKFSLVELITVLFDDMLTQVKKGKLSNKQLAHILLDGKQRYYTTMKPKKIKEIKKVSTYLYQLRDIEEKNKYVQNIDEYTCIKVVLHESLINRGEMLLDELKPYLGSIIITFEEMLVIRYLHFLHLIKTEGNDETVILTILKNLGYIEEE